MPKLKNKLERLENLDVIKSIDFPTDWCSPIVVVPKKDLGEIRLCIDFTELNKNVKRAIHSLIKIDILLASLK